jgi:hypothetical protein
MHPHKLTLLVTVTLMLAVLVGLVLGFVGLSVVTPGARVHALQPVNRVKVNRFR